MREEPCEFQIFQKVGHDGPAHFFPSGHPLVLRTPTSLFIGPQLHFETLRDSIAVLG
jgi:hypothetical protein